MDWDSPNIVLQDVLEEINENTKFVENEVTKLLQHIRNVGERGTRRDITQLGRTIIKNFQSKKKDVSRPTLKRLNAYSQVKDLDTTLLKENIIHNAELFKKPDFEDEDEDQAPKRESFLKLNYEDLGFRDPKCKINLHLDKVPLHTLIKDEEKEFHNELVNDYMKLQTERLLFREKFKKPETLLEMITLVDNMTDLLDMIDELQKEDLKGFKWSTEDDVDTAAVEEEKDEKLKVNVLEDSADNIERDDDSDVKGDRRTDTLDDHLAESFTDTLGEGSEKEFGHINEDEELALSLSSEEEDEAGETEANREAMRILFERLKRAVDDEYVSLDQLVLEEDYTPELILRQIFYSKSALKLIDLENDCLLLFLIKNAPQLLIRSNITSPPHHRINRNGRILVRLLFKNKLLKPMPRFKRKRNPPKWIIDDDCSISTVSTDASSNDESFPYIERKKLMATQATEDLRTLSDILRVQINDKFIKATGVRHELFSHYIDITNEEKLFKKACNKTTNNFPQVMYLFWKRWLLSNLQDLIFMESRGRLISKSIGSMLHMKKHFDYLESITQYGDKLHQQVIYDSVAEEYNMLSDGVYDLRKAIADLLNDIFFSCHKIDNKIEEYNSIKKEADSIQTQIKTCNRIRRREKEKYNKIKTVLDATKVEPKKVVFRSHDQASPNINIYIKYKMKNNFTRHALNRLQQLVRSQDHKVKSFTNQSAPVKYQYIKFKHLKGFESMLRMVKRSFDSSGDFPLKLPQKSPKKRPKKRIKKRRIRRNRK